LLIGAFSITKLVPGPCPDPAFAEAIHAKFPDKLLPHYCSPSFNWAAKLSVEQMEPFLEELTALGYKFQFITLAGFHALNARIFELAQACRQRGIAGYPEVQEREVALAKDGYQALKHQSFVGTGCFDAVQNVMTSKQTSTSALVGSTEEAQFQTTLLTTVARGTHPMAGAPFHAHSK
jgi:isocitrate lyase